ncbi:HEAT repeat protein, putative [Babesia caballi]|uniref:HEAT repeat protein, putative n=1 Tax=Babesia caballi TaxID=5871 RepID=A0AAV4LMT1_BABCB|nr:HEAT repeat protein, putative [Babesia caballi]
MLWWFYQVSQPLLDGIVVQAPNDVVYGPVDSFKLTYFIYAGYFEETTPVASYRLSERFEGTYHELRKLLPMLERDFEEHCDAFFGCSHYMDELLQPENEDVVDPDIKPSTHHLRSPSVSGRSVPQRPVDAGGVSISHHQSPADSGGRDSPAPIDRHPSYQELTCPKAGPTDLVARRPGSQQSHPSFSNNIAHPASGTMYHDLASFDSGVFRGGDAAVHSELAIPMHLQSILLYENSQQVASIPPPSPNSRRSSSGPFYSSRLTRELWVPTTEEALRPRISSGDFAGFKTMTTSVTFQMSRQPTRDADGQGGPRHDAPAERPLALPPIDIPPINLPRWSADTPTPAALDGASYSSFDGRKPTRSPSPAPPPMPVQSHDRHWHYDGSTDQWHSPSEPTATAHTPGFTVDATPQLRSPAMDAYGAPAPWGSPLLRPPPPPQRGARYNGGMAFAPADGLESGDSLGASRHGGGGRSHGEAVSAHQMLIKQRLQSNLRETHEHLSRVPGHSHVDQLAQAHRDLAGQRLERRRVLLLRQVRVHELQPRYLVDGAAHRVVDRAPAQLVAALRRLRDRLEAVVVEGHDAAQHAVGLDERALVVVVGEGVLLQKVLPDDLGHLQRHLLVLRERVAPDQLDDLQQLALLLQNVLQHLHVGHELGAGLLEVALQLLLVLGEGGGPVD